MYADVELLIVGWLPTVLEGVRSCTDLPANLEQAVPLVQVARFGGSDQSHALDAANVAVDSFAATRADASTLAEQVRQAFLYRLPGLVLGTTTITRVATIGAPVWSPYGNSTVRRYAGSYQIVAQTRAATVGS